MAIVKTQRAGGSRRPTVSPGAQWADVIVTRRPPGGSIEAAERTWRRSASRVMRSTPGVAENGGFISTTVGRTSCSRVRDELGFERGHHGLRKQLGQKPRPRLRVFVEMEIAGDGVAERALRHHRQHPGAGGGLEHDVARPDRGGLERGVGERQRGRELLEPNLLFRAPGVGGLQRGDGFQHRQHAARPAVAGVAAHAPAVALHEDHDGRLGGLVGVLPDPAALGVRGAEGLRHGVPEGRGVERPARLQHRQQG